MPNQGTNTMKRKVCILGTLHQYQYEAPRPQYVQTVRDLIVIHSVDLVAEEASGVPGATYVQKLLSAEFKSHIAWRNVDLTAEERKGIPDIIRAVLERFKIFILICPENRPG
jgi:hypothetical protein